MNRFWGGFGFGPPFNVTGNVNAAIGGAQATGGVIPSVQTQIGLYQLVGGTFGPNDLVSVQGGANDFFNFFATNPTPTVAALQIFATQVGVNEAANVSSLIQAGAKTLLVSNLPNIGATPSFNGTAAGAAGGQFATTTYNAALNQGVQQLAALNPRVNLVQMDWFSALNVILANPAAFGFTNVKDACTASLACILSNAQGFLFWDGVHPTAAGHQLLAEYAALLLSTEQTGRAVGALGQVGLSTRLDASDILFRRGAVPGANRPGGLYAEAIGQSGSVDGEKMSVYNNNGIDYSLAGVRAGFDASSGLTSFGSALAYQAGSINAGSLRSDLRTTQIDGYVMTRFASFFAGVEGGLSFNEYSDLKRETGFPTVEGKGSTRGVDFTVAGTAGSQYDIRGIIFTPAVRAGYASINIDGFTESAPVLGLEYSDRNITTGFWTARLRAATPLWGFQRATVYGEAGYENLFATDGSYTAKLAFNTAHAVTINNEDLNARGLFFKAGVAGNLTNTVKISAEYGFSDQNGNGDVHSGRLQLTIPLHAE